MKIYTLNLIIDSDGNIIHSEEKIDNVHSEDKKEAPGTAIDATTLEDMIIMELNDEDVARA